MTKTLPTITIDGRTHEGGGQILRLAAGLSAITGKAITITNIRANRSSTGLRGSHVAAIRCLEAISASGVQGVELGSESVVFNPAGPVSSSPLSPSSSSKTTKGKKKKQSGHNASADGSATHPLVVISRNPNNANGSFTEPERQITITQRTNGASFLIFQAIYPYLLASVHQPIRVRIIGGTNSRSAPTFDYVEQVLLPNFALFRLPSVSVNLQKRGWDTGPFSLGEVTLDVQPLPQVVDDSNDEDRGHDTDGNTPLPRVFPEIDLNRYSRGRIKTIQVTILAPDDTIPRNIREEVGFNPDAENMPPHRHGRAYTFHTLREYLEYQTYLQIGRRLSHLRNDLFVGPSGVDGSPNGYVTGEVTTNTYRSEKTYHSSHMYVLLVAEMDNGFRIAVDSVGPGATRYAQDNAYMRMGSAKTLAETCVLRFVDEISTARFDAGGREPCVDQNMRDQMVVFEALSPTPPSRSLSSVEQEDPRYWSLHTRTAKWVCERILGSEPE